MPAIKNYLSLIKFSHTIFALPFAIIGFALALTKVTIIPNADIAWPNTIVNSNDVREIVMQLSWQQIGIKFSSMLVCMVTARSAAMAFNRYLDRQFDAKNPRTAIREIPSGIIKANNALAFVIINCIAFVITTFLINRICFYLSPIALFVILFYSYTKRFTALCHLVLGLGLSLAPIGAYLVVTGFFSLLPILFSIAVLFWVAGFDIIYAMQDVDFDSKENLHSIPTFLGKERALQLSEWLHVVSAAAIVYAGVLGHFSFVYWLAVLVFIGMLIYQHLLVKPTDLSKVNIAFMTANGIASVVFGVLVILDIAYFSYKIFI